MELDTVSLLPFLSRNIDLLRQRLGAPENMDVIVRRFRAGAFEAALIAVDGMADIKTINENILKPCMDLPKTAGQDVGAPSRIGFLMENAVSVLPMKLKDNVDMILSDALSGQSVLLCEGCAMACVMDTRGFEKRSIGRPEAEKVVLGPHESFSESIRTSITQLRRIMQREDLITEFLSVGGGTKTRCALLYLRDTADEAMLAQIRRRLLSCGSDFPLSLGDVEQIIEQHPLSLIPQCVRTERPDRAASFLAEGQIVILADGSPEALGAPATLYHQLHTPDDASMRWQYGTFLRMIRLLGVLIHLFLPGVYLAVLRFHPDLLSAMLLTSVYETGSRVPFPVFLEALLMTLAFSLISEAGLRAPGAMGNALGIVSGLILGQSAVSADIVSPLLLIVVAASGLGGFCVPNYALSVGLKMTQLALMCAGAAGGLFAMGLLTLSMLCLLCSMSSLSSPLTAPLSPPRRKNPDILLRLPVHLQKAHAFFSSRENQAAGKGASASDAVHRRRILAAFRVRACAAALCIAMQVFSLGTGAAMALSLNAAWLSALVCVPAAWIAAALCRKRLILSLRSGKHGRLQHIALCLTLSACCLCQMGALLSLAQQTFLSQAKMLFILSSALLFLFLCAAGGESGVFRAAFLLRWPALLLPALLLIRCAAAGSASGLFPLLGTGARPLLLSLLPMLSSAAPALLLLLPLQNAGSVSPQDVPPARFFAWRAALGAAAGVLLLLGMTLGTTHETIGGYLTWGERLRLIPSGGGRGGLLISGLTLGQLALLLLGSAMTFLGAGHALSQAFPSPPAKRFCFPGLFLSVSAALAAAIVFGFSFALWAGTLAGLPAIAPLLPRKRSDPTRPPTGNSAQQEAP